jgi:hypothetical protein
VGVPEEEANHRQGRTGEGESSSIIFCEIFFRYGLCWFFVVANLYSIRDLIQIIIEVFPLRLPFLKYLKLSLLEE